MKYHKVILMEHEGKLVSVGLTSTEALSESDAFHIIRGAHPIIPITKIEMYAKEVIDAKKALLNLEKKFKNKDINEAKKYCEKKEISYGITLG